MFGLSLIHRAEKNLEQDVDKVSEGMLRYLVWMSDQTAIHGRNEPEESADIATELFCQLFTGFYVVGGLQKCWYHSTGYKA